MNSSGTAHELLRKEIEHIDIKSLDCRALVSAFEHMAFSARDLNRAAQIYERMLSDERCVVLLGLAGSLISSGLKQVIVDMIDARMVDAIVTTGANIVDQDFFEGLGYRHYVGTPNVSDEHLQNLGIDRIYDTFISETDLRECDRVVGNIADSLEPRVYSSGEFLEALGVWLNERAPENDSILGHAAAAGVPIFSPALADSSAGFGMIQHQFRHPGAHVAIDGARDFLELALLKMSSADSGFMFLGGGVPKNFVQDITVACETLEVPRPMHKYAIQITVADSRDGALSGSTLREACSWGKVGIANEQMVFSEVTLALPLLASYLYHGGAWKARESRDCSAFLRSARERGLSAAVESQRAAELAEA